MPKILAANKDTKEASMIALKGLLHKAKTGTLLPDDRIISREQLFPRSYKWTVYRKLQQLYPKYNNWGEL